MRQVPPMRLASVASGAGNALTNRMLYHACLPASAPSEASGHLCSHGDCLLSFLKWLVLAALATDAALALKHAQVA